MTNSGDSLNDGPAADRVVVAIIGVFGVFVNTATLVVMLRNFTRIFSNAEACFVTNLCAADLGTNIGAILWAIFPASRYKTGLVETVFCALWATVSVSFLTLSCMAFERLLVVVNPIRAQRLVKKPFAYICCAVVWCISLFTASMIAVNTPIAQFAMVLLFDLSLIATIGCYIRIYLTVRKLNNDGRRTAARYNAKSAKMKIEVEENEPALHHRVAVRQEARITKLVFVLILILVITVLPYMLLLQVAVVHILSCPSCNNASISAALDILFPIEMLNFVINPAVYAWRLPKFRQASRGTLDQIICCKKWRAGSRSADAVDERNYSCSSSSESVANGPATFFTGQTSAFETLNHKNGNPDNF